MKKYSILNTVYFAICYYSCAHKKPECEFNKVHNFTPTVYILHFQSTNVYVFCLPKGGKGIPGDMGAEGPPGSKVSEKPHAIGFHVGHPVSDMGKIKTQHTLYLL